MKKYIFGRAIIFLLSSLCLAEASSWRTAKSTHFIVHFRGAEEKFIAELIEKAEDYYERIADDLGFRRYNFWLWDNRAKIYIYDDAQAYQSVTGRPHWSFGSAIAKEKIIHTFPNEQGFFERTLPHEIAHIIFREFIGFDNTAIPLWLDEGVASYQERLNPQAVQSFVKEALKKGNFVPLENLSDFKPNLEQDNEAVKLFYAESITLVNYLIKEFGADNFVFFCKTLRDKKDLNEALASSYPFKDIKALSMAWQEYLEE